MLDKSLPWETYWQSTSLNTFDESFDTGNIIADAFEQQLKAITIANPPGLAAASLLDLGCGNGAHFNWLRTLMSHWGDSARSIVGVDFAVASTVIDASTRIIQADFEHLDVLGSINIDIVFSMYAIEYSNLENSLRSVVDVVNKPTNGLFLLHTPNSTISQKSLTTRKFYQLFLNKMLSEALLCLEDTADMKLFETKVLDVIKPIALSGKQDIMFDLQSVAQRLKKMFTGITTSDEQNLSQFKAYFESLKMHDLRLEQQLKAAENSESLVTELEKLGCEVKLNNIVTTEYGEVGRFVHFVV